MSTSPGPWAQIIQSGEVVAVVILNSAQAQQATNKTYSYVNIFGLTCTDGSAIVPGCTYQGGTIFTSLPKDAYNRSVTMVSNLVTDTYTVTDLGGNGFSLTFPTGTTQQAVYAQINGTNIPSPSYAVSVVLTQFYEAIEGYLDGVYDADGKFEILMLYLDAVNNSLANRLKYLQQFTSWYNSVTAYKVSYASSLANQTAAGAFKATWDIPANTQPLPNVTAAGALAIPN
jgi:hypothetical protein